MEKVEQLTDAQRQLIEDNIKLVHLSVWKYFPTYASDDDIISCGYLGLCRAASSWDESKGTFSTFACVCIRNEIGLELRRRNKRIIADSFEMEIYEDMTLEETLEGGEEIEILDTNDEEFIESLSDLEKKILVLRQQGYRRREIVKITELTINEVKYLFQKIKKKYLKTHPTQ